MFWTIRGMFLFLLLLLACKAKDNAQNNPEPANGNFTGKIKSVIYVSDVEKSAPFYREVLGFDFQGFANSGGQPYYAEMSVAGVKFGLHEPTSEGQETKVGQQRLYFRLKDLQAQRTRILAHGGDAGEVKHTDWMDMFLVRDPDGNEIFFAVTDPEHHSINPWNTGKPVTGAEKKTQ